MLRPCVRLFVRTRGRRIHVPAVLQLGTWQSHCCLIAYKAACAVTARADVAHGKSQAACCDKRHFSGGVRGLSPFRPPAHADVSTLVPLFRPPARAPLKGSGKSSLISRLGHPRPQLHHDGAHRAHICVLRAGTGLTPATSAPGLGSPRPQLHRDRGRPCYICAGTGLAPATSAQGLGSPLPHLRRDWAHPAHICAGTA
jgi:hypothetical protein